MVSNVFTILIIYGIKLKNTEVNVVYLLDGIIACAILHNIIQANR